jgi:hypothetical protein
MWLSQNYKFMSAENIINTEKRLETSQTPEVSKNQNLSGRVNINDLLARVRDEQKKQNKVNMTFFGIFASLVIVVGIILSF